MKFEITLEQAQELAKYLQMKPFIEVRHLIQILESLKKLEEQNEKAS